MKPQMLITKGGIKMKHTPWAVDGFDLTSVIVKEGNGYKKICTCDGEFPVEENIAHCRLIASAPELLEACKRVLLDYEKLGKQIDPAYGIVKQAIAKAEGKE
jgi:hypothetical protein